MPDSVRRSSVAATKGSYAAAGRLARLHQRLDRGEPRLRALPLLPETELLRRRHDLFFQEAPEVLLRLPDVVDVPALLALPGRVDDQTLGRLLGSHRGAPDHLLRELPVHVLGA